MKYDVIVVGGGPSGATAAEDLVRSGHTVALLDRKGRIKPCGGAVPPRLIAAERRLRGRIGRDHARADVCLGSACRKDKI